MKERWYDMTEAVFELHGEEERSERIILMDIEKNCFECKHFHEDEQTCDAYPDGVPPEYLYGDEVHDVDHSGDHGIHFEPKTRR